MICGLSRYKSELNSVTFTTMASTSNFYPRPVVGIVFLRLHFLSVGTVLFMMNYTFRACFSLDFVLQNGL